MALLAPLLLAVSPTVAAQQVDRPCAETVAPVDDFQSTGIGLTSDELAALYGEGEVGQSSIFYDFQGIDLHKDGCDLILAFPHRLVRRRAACMSSRWRNHSCRPMPSMPGRSRAARRSGLEAAASLWRSDSLAERFAQWDENRGGEILILYTYEQEGIEPGPIQRIELRTLELPE